MSSKKQRKPRGLKVPDFTGDHGPKTAAQMQGAVVEEVDGESHNRVGRKRRENVLERMHKGRGDQHPPHLTMRQYQAGCEIQEAFCQIEKLSSGSSDYERPIVDSSPKPDQFVAMHIDAQSRFNNAMKKVPSDMRYVVEHVCWQNQSLSGLCKHPNDIGMHRANLKVALDLVANHMRY